jgi:hypothetical protein
MPYSSFNLSTVFKQFDLLFTQGEPLPITFTPIAPSEGLKYMLGLGASLAIDQSTEKARSEFIIAPILLEVRGIVGRSVSVFSGVEFNVDSEQGLIGVCDFLFSRSNQQMFLEAPILTVVEAKNENFKQGIAQAVAEMVAAQIFNDREGKPQPIIYGAVTIGSQWQFLMLVQKTVRVDNRFYDLDDLPSILGILTSMLQ